MKATAIYLVTLIGVTAGRMTAKRQAGPVDPSTDPDCSYYDTAYSASDDCTCFENYWGLSHADFVKWVGTSTPVLVKSL